MTLARRFARVDKLKADLAKAEADLKADIRTYAQRQGLKMVPRPEQIRNAINA